MENFFHCEKMSRWCTPRKCNLTINKSSLRIFTTQKLPPTSFPFYSMKIANDLLFRYCIFPHRVLLNFIIQLLHKKTRYFYGMTWNLKVTLATLWNHLTHNFPRSLLLLSIWMFHSAWNFSRDTRCNSFLYSKKKILIFLSCCKFALCLFIPSTSTNCKLMQRKNNA